MAGFPGGSPYVSPGQIVKVPGGTLEDPYNWKKIAADLKAEETRRNSCNRSRAATPKAPKAVQAKQHHKLRLLLLKSF